MKKIRMKCKHIYPFGITALLCHVLLWTSFAEQGSLYQSGCPVRKPAGEQNGMGAGEQESSIDGIVGRQEVQLHY